MTSPSVPPNDQPDPLAHIPAETISASQRSEVRVSVERPDPRRRVTLVMRALLKQKGDRSKEVQQESARILKLLPELSQRGNEVLINAAEVAIKALLLDHPNVEFAKEIRSYLEKELASWRMPIRRAWRGSPPMRATLGLIFFLWGALFVGYLLWVFAGVLPGRRAGINIQGIDQTLFWLTAASGGVGSIVRVPRMAEDFKTASVEVPFFVGLFKPIIGIAFALFLFAAIKGGILPLEEPETGETAFFIAIAFVAGFSERFVPDIISKTEKANNVGSST